MFPTRTRQQTQRNTMSPDGNCREGWDLGHNDAEKHDSLRQHIIYDNIFNR